MIRQFALAASLFAAAVPASAADSNGISCPAADTAGRPLRAGANGTLYFGDPAKKGSQAPDGRDGNANVFRLPQGGAGYVLVCDYQGGFSGTPIKVPASAKACRQDAASFSCR